MRLTPDSNRCRENSPSTKPGAIHFSEASMLELATMNNPVEVIDKAVILPELVAA